MRRVKEKRPVKRGQAAECRDESGEMRSANFFGSSELDRTLREIDGWLQQERAGDVPPLSEEETQALLKRVTDRINAGEVRQTDALQNEWSQETAAASKADSGKASGVSDRTDRSERRQKPRRRWRLTACAAAVLICLPVLLTVVYIGLPAAKSDSMKQDGDFIKDDNDGNQDAGEMPETPMEPSDKLDCGWDNLQGALLIQIGGGAGEGSYAGEGGQTDEGSYAGEGDQTGEGDQAGEGSQADGDGFEAEVIAGYGSAALRQAVGGQVRLQWTGEAAAPSMEAGQLWLVFVLGQTDEGVRILSDQYVRLDDFSANMPALPLLTALSSSVDSVYPATADELLALMEELN